MSGIGKNKPPAVLLSSLHSLLGNDADHFLNDGEVEVDDFSENPIYS